VQAFGFSDLGNFAARPAATPTAEPTPTGTPRTAASTPTPGAPNAAAAIDAANWIVVSMIDFDPKASSSAQTFRDFLSQRAETLRDKKIVVFAFGAPYHLDSTEVTKLTAYFALYQRGQPALEAAVRALYGEYGQGASPVSVSAISYSIAEQTQADPKQIIPLVPLGATDVSTRTVGTPAPLSPRLNDTLRVRAGPILDRNGRVIPDGTPVQFILAYPTEGVREPQERRVASRNGFAEVTITFERKGKLQISARTDTARQSDLIEANISDAAGEVVVSRPTPFPTITSEPPPTVTPRPTETAVPPRPTATPPAAPPARSNLLAGFGLTLMILSGLALAAALLWRLRSPSAPEALIARNTLWSWTTGWAAYVAFGLLAPASTLAGSGWALATGIAVVAAVATLIALWRAQLAGAKVKRARAPAGM
jgi:beta-N-acetylhexosaminidase